MIQQITGQIAQQAPPLAITNQETTQQAAAKTDSQAKVDKRMEADLDVSGAKSPDSSSSDEPDRKPVIRFQDQSSDSGYLFYLSLSSLPLIINLFTLYLSVSFWKCVL